MYRMKPRPALPDTFATRYARDRRNGDRLATVMILGGFVLSVVMRHYHIDPIGQCEAWWHAQEVLCSATNDPCNHPSMYAVVR
jgi:hypothetical protein